MARLSPREGWALVGLAVVVALFLALPTAFSTDYQIVRHATCGTGSSLAQGVFWTPVAIVDSPPNFNNSTTFATASGWAPHVAPALFNVSDGEAAGVFSLDRWALESQHLIWSWGPGAIPTCPSVIGVDLSRAGPQDAQPVENLSILVPNGSSSDVGVPDTLSLPAPNETVYASVYFFANYTDGVGNLSFARITSSDQLVGSGGYQSSTETEVGATFLVIVPFVSPTGRPMPYLTWLVGVESMEYYLFSPWYGCIQWFGDIANPFGTGLSFGPGPTHGYSCLYP